METYYYAVIKKTESEPPYFVEIPDINNCMTQGYTMEEAIEMAEDVLAIMLAEPENADKKATDFETMVKKHGGPDVYIMRIPVRLDLMYDYSEKVRVNISLPARSLEEIDTFAKKHKMNRSKFIDYAAHKAMAKASQQGLTL